MIKKRLLVILLFGFFAAAPILRTQVTQQQRPPGAMSEAERRGNLPRLILNEVYADFSKGAGTPLFKSKFNLYDPVGPTMQQFDQNLDKLREVNVDNYRIEIAWGRGPRGFGTAMGVGGTADNITYDFTALDHMVKGLASQNVRLLGSYGYTPTPLQDPNEQRFRSSTPPKDAPKWGEIAGVFAKHYKDIGLPFGINEIWNEADGILTFFNGKPEEYYALYRAGVKAIREANPDAYIAGPASAPELAWYLTFPEFIDKNKLPLDAYTFHSYGSAELTNRLIDEVGGSLSRFPYLNTTAMVLDEWHDADCCNWCWDDVRHRYQGASQMLHDFQILLGRTELTSVSWAWWLDPPSRGAGCMGLLTGDGKRKAVFNAWKIYAGMPVDRAQVTLHGPIEAMASSDAHKATVVAWNPNPYLRRVDIHLSNIPFAKGNVRIFRIDDKHASVVDGAPENLEPVETFMGVDTAKWTWVDGAIPPNATVYVEAEDGSGTSELTPMNVADVIRINRYFPARGKTNSYSDFDRKTWIARLGSADDAAAQQQIGVLADGLPAALNVTTKVEGVLKKQNPNSLLGVRVDYAVSGAYPKSVLYHGKYNGTDLYDAARTAGSPWGIGAKLPQAVAVENLAGFRIPLREGAPAGWNGKAHLTFILQSTGPGVRAKFTVRGQ